MTLGGPDIASLLQGKEREIIDRIGEAYVIHGAGDSCLPHSVFVRFPDMKRERTVSKCNTTTLTAIMAARPVRA